MAQVLVTHLLTLVTHLLTLSGLSNGWVVRLSHRSTAAGGFAAEHPAGRSYRSVAVGTPVLSSKCGSC